ncbi:calmodulin-binding protein 60 F-like [Juglans regia]|uniref:Calmodulin-binding protein 60 F-like n=1 Tax=Juglans regia TaxID=51240 RepID=A0A6P9EFG7_JUGRE|nr:calmodulin-binding protein 60 F-like [Juglans regia]
METSRSNIVEKKGNERGILEDDAVDVPGSKKPKLPALAIVIVEAVKVYSLQRLCSSLAPLLRKFVSREVIFFPC